MPRRADGVWVDANGNVVYRSDPNDTGVDRSRATFKDGFWVDNKTGEKIPNRNDLPQRVPGTKAGAPGSTVWPDGTPVTPEQHGEINKQAGGAPPSPGAPNYGITGFADPSMATTNYLPENAPGATLPTAQADADRQRMADYLAQLEGQAKTGGGAWEGQLAQATQQGVDASTALGQSAAGIDPLAMRRNIGNARAGVEQRAAGQAETLRQQTKQQAQGQLSDIYSAQASLDAQQAAEDAAARQGRREANQAITDKANETNQGIYKAAADAFVTIATMGAGGGGGMAKGGLVRELSNGGPVPGKAKVFGDDSANDTVKAMLSPGEIVLPRSVTQSDDPAVAAAAFVQAVKEHKGQTHFDDGGKVPDPGDPWATKPDSNAADAMPVLANDSSVTGAGTQVLPWQIGMPQKPASVRDGGLLDTTAYNASRDAALGSTQAFLDAFGGRGPSVAPQATRTATDENIAAAMAAQAGVRGSGRGAAAGLIADRAAQEQAGIAGRAGETAGQEAAQGGRAYAAAIQRQRAMDLAFAQAQQQAAWRNSMLNAGIGLQQQAQIRGLLSGAGQAFAAGAGALANKDWSDGSDELSSDPWTQDSAPSEPGDYYDGWSDSEDGGNSWDRPSWAGDSDTAYAAHGGEIRDRDFARAYADGGEVSWTDRAKKALSMAVPILSGRGGPWAGAQGAAGAVGDQMRGQLEDEAIMRAQPDPRYSPEQAFDIETQNPVKLAALNRLSMSGAQMAGSLAPNKTMLQGLVAKLKDKEGILYGTTKDKAWIGDLYEQMNKEGYEMSRPEFEKFLLDAHRAGDINLSRQDLVVGVDKAKSAASEVKGAAGSQFHRVDVPEGFAAGGEVDSLDAGTELAGPRDEGALQAPPFSAAARPPTDLPVAAPLAPPRAGLPMAAPRAVPDRRPIGALDKPDAFALEQQAEMAKTSALEDLGRAQAEAAIGAQKALERGAIEQKEAHARARMTADADMARILEARQAVSSMSDTVDPGRWWASRSTPGKIAAAIGLALGAIGAGNDGVNRAVGIIENAIGRDLEAQKAEHQIRMRKGQMAVDSATSIYTLHRQLAQDDIGATDAAKATAMELAKNQIEVATARASSPLAKAQGQALIAQLSKKRDAFDAATKQNSFDNYIKREDMETRRIAAQRERTSQAGRDFVAPGYKLQPGAAPKTEELGKWRDALAEKRNTDIATRKLKDLIDKSSFTPGGSESAQAQSLISDLKISYKNMAALGALSGEDYALVEASIPDPTSFRGHFTPDKTLKSRLDQFAKTAENKLNNKASVLGIIRDEEAEAQSGGAQTATGKNGEKYRKRPDGKWELIQ